MAVYREGYYAIEQYSKLKTRIYNDACDQGVFVKKDDFNWNLFKQLVEWYGSKETRIEDESGVSNVVELMDEWAVSDGSKTVKQATERFKVYYFKLKPHPSLTQNGYSGFISIDKI